MANEDEPQAEDYDSPWKDVIHRFFPRLLEFYFPAAHADIDWNLGWRPLDTELRQIVRDAEKGPKVADKKETAALMGALDWMMALPKELALESLRVAEEMEATVGKKFVTSWERIGEERGRAEGRADGIRRTLLTLGEKRFGAPVDSVRETLDAIRGADALSAMAARLLEVESWEELMSP